MKVKEKKIKRDKKVRDVLSLFYEAHNSEVYFKTNELTNEEIKTAYYSKYKQHLLEHDLEIILAELLDQRWIEKLESTLYLTSHKITNKGIIEVEDTWWDKNIKWVKNPDNTWKILLALSPVCITLFITTCVSKNTTNNISNDKNTSSVVKQQIPLYDKLYSLTINPEKLITSSDTSSKATAFISKQPSIAKPVVEIKKYFDTQTEPNTTNPLFGTQTMPNLKNANFGTNYGQIGDNIITSEKPNELSDKIINGVLYTLDSLLLKLPKNKRDCIIITSDDNNLKAMRAANEIYSKLERKNFKNLMSGSGKFKTPYPIYLELDEDRGCINIFVRTP
jgi:hypothetical protein